MNANDYGSSGGSVIFSLLIYAALIVADWLLFEKAGEPGWQSLIPGLNLWKLFEIVYGSGWKCLLLLVPVLNIVIAVLLPFRIAKAYGQGILYGLGMLILPPVMTLVLAFGPSKYRGYCYSFI